MKPNLLFMVMDLLTLIAFPIVFVRGKLCQFSKSKESNTLSSSLLVTGPVTPSR